MKKNYLVGAGILVVIIVVVFFIFPGEDLMTNSENAEMAGDGAGAGSLIGEEDFESLDGSGDEDCEVMFTEYFVDPDYVDKVGQIGVLHGSGRFTVGRSYVSLKDGLDLDKIPIYAPTDMILSQGAYYQDPMSVGKADYLPDYALDFDAGCGVTITYAHLKIVVDSIKNQLPDVKSDSRTSRLDRIEFVAGDLVGYFIQNTGVAGFDFMVHDSNVVNQFANQERQEFGYGTNLLHAVCPYDFYSGQKREEYYSLIGGGGGTLFEVQECGPISRDFPGTISGLWFLEKEVTRSLYDYYMDGDYGSVLPVTGNEERVEIGTLGDRSQNWVYSFSSTYKLPGDVVDEHCYEFDGSNQGDNFGWAYFKLVDDETMEVVYSRDGSCPGSFPGNGKMYYR